LFTVILASHNLSPLLNDFKCGRVIIQLFSDLITNQRFFVPTSALFIFFFNWNNDYASRQLFIRLRTLLALVGWNGGFIECFWCLLDELVVVELKLSLRGIFEPL
jgi:hypothetical protein